MAGFICTSYEKSKWVCEDFTTTGCGRKKFPIWEANKFKTKEDTANVFMFLESTQNAVLTHCVICVFALQL
jgi:hypothetical protein